MRKLILALATVLAVAISAVPAHAHPPTSASGDWTYVPTVIEIVKVAGQNTFIYGEDVGEWHGTFEGTSTEQFILVNHARAGFNNYAGVIQFTGTVADSDGTLRSGTMVIHTHGRQDPGTLEPSPNLWEGSWVIVSGTGDLADLHGRGTFTGPSLDLDYAGQIHFRP